MDVVVIDDDYEFVCKMRSMLSAIEHVHILGTATSLEQALELLESCSPDIVFLDVELQGHTGFDVLNKLKSIDFYTVFITSHQHYALKAIKFSALDYLLKPFSQADLSASICKAEIGKHHNNNKPMDVLMQNHGQLLAQKKRIGLTTFEGTHFILLEDIIRCKADGNYCEFYLAKGAKLLVSSPIKRYDELLEEYGFFRAHKSHLINLHHVGSFMKLNGGTVLMSDGEQIEVARRKKELFLVKLNLL